MKKQLFENLETIRRWRQCVLPLTIAFTVLALTQSIRWLPVPVGLWLFTVSTVIVVGALILLFFNRRKLQNTAAELDERQATHNEFETAVELADSNHPLKEAQFSAAEIRWGKNRRIIIWAQIALPGILLAGTLFLTVADLVLFASLNQRGKEQKNTPLPEEQPAAAQPRQSPPKPEAIKATLEITYPEDDPGYKPIDPIEYEARAISPSGYSALRCHLSINGEQTSLKPIDLNSAKRDGQTLFLAGEILPDEEGAAVYDLVTLRLSGTLPGGQEISSLPRTFRMKPLRKEIGIVDIPNGDSPSHQKMYLTLTDLLERQLKLNELFYIGRNALELDPEPDRESFQLFTAEQERLRNDTQTFRTVNQDRTDTLAVFNVRMLTEINAAIEEMHNAVNALKTAPDKKRLAAAPLAQQRAAGHLSRAIEEIHEVVNRNQSKAPQSDSAKPKSAKPNPAQLLEKAISEESNLLNQTADSPDAQLPAQAAAIQSGITWTLRLLAERNDLSQRFVDTIDKALGSSAQSETAVTSQAPQAFRHHAGSTLESMREALRILREKLDGEEERSLTDARQTLRKLSAQATQKGDQKAGAPLEKQMRDLARKLKQDAEAVAKCSSGNPSDSPLSKLGKATEKAAAGLAKKSGKEAADLMQKLLEQCNDSRPLPEAADPAAMAKKFESLARELEYLRKHGKQQDAELWKDELQRTIHTAGRQKEAPIFQELANQVMTLERDPNPPASLLDELAKNLKTAADLFAREAAMQRRPPTLFQFTPDRIPQEYRDAAARYFETLSKLNSEQSAENSTHGTR